MEAPLQQRIVGAIVLVTLGVIFIPALLDGSGYKTRQAKDIVIREKPTFPPLSQKKLEPIPTPLDKNKSITTIKPLPEKAEDKQTDNKQIVAAKPEIAEPLKAVDENNSAKSLPSKDISSKDQSLKKTPIKSFAIQVGTFDSNENAENVRDQLRKAGYTAYILKSGSKSKTSYRVRIGPELDYDVLEKMLVKLKKSKKYDGYIVNHP